MKRVCAWTIAFFAMSLSANGETYVTQMPQTVFEIAQSMGVALGKLIIMNPEFASAYEDDREIPAGTNFIWVSQDDVRCAFAFLANWGVEWWYTVEGSQWQGISYFATDSEDRISYRAVLSFAQEARAKGLCGEQAPAVLQADAGRDPQSEPNASFGEVTKAMSLAPEKGQ